MTGVSRDPFERHARSSDDWDSQGQRSAGLRAAMSDDPEPPKRRPGRKDKRRWCRGKPGVEHVREIAYEADSYRWRGESCRWRCMWNIKAQDYAAEWVCSHRERCAACKRVLRESWDLLAEECPDYPGDQGQRAEAEAKVISARESRSAWLERWSPPRRRITGPQGYRRRRGT